MSFIALNSWIQFHLWLSFSGRGAVLSAGPKVLRVMWNSQLSLRSGLLVIKNHVILVVT